MNQKNRPIVAIVGRPNVGKSTLFNRLLGRPVAIVSDVAGTTRDRVIGEAEWGGRSIVVVDTGGLEASPETEILQGVQAQVAVAVGDSDVVIMLTDVADGVLPADRDAAELLRRAGRPVVLAANKADNPQREADAVDFYGLGLGAPLAISAYHNVGIDDMMTQVIARIPSPSELVEPEADLRLAIVGRTNVGKSMLLNAMSEQERAIVSGVPGTTRDALDTLMLYGDRRVLLIDTAGIRRSGRIVPGIERYSVLRSVRAIDRADVVILLMDAAELATSQDTHIAGYVLDSYKGIILAVNKWDLAPQLEMAEEDALKRVAERFNFASYAPVSFVSALEGFGIDELLPTAFGVYAHWTKSLPRYDLRRTVMNAVAEHPPSMSGRRSLKVYGVTQDRAGPPSFTFYVNRSDLVHFSYRRYLENRLRRAYEFKGSPLRMRFIGRGEHPVE